MCSAEARRTSSIPDSVRQHLEKLYKTFRNYRVEDFSKVGCFDCGPTEEELSGISKDLRSIPNEALSGMEFFGEGWDSWGTEQEVKYFLPRLLEYTAEDVSRLDDAGLFSLFKYKLRGCLSPKNNEWTEAERASLQGIIEALLSDQFSHSTQVGMLVECAIALGIRPEDVASKWKSTGQLRRNQAHHLTEHFGGSLAADGTTPKWPNAGAIRGTYLDDSQRVKAYLDQLFRSGAENVG